MTRAIAQKKGEDRGTALLGETPAGSFQKASIEVWDWDYVTGTGTTRASREDPRVSCGRPRGRRASACSPSGHGRGCSPAATGSSPRRRSRSTSASRSMRLIEKPVCCKDLDLDSLGGRAPPFDRRWRNARSRRSRFSSNEAMRRTRISRGDAKRLRNPKKPKNTNAARVEPESGAVARMRNSGRRRFRERSRVAACAPECAFQLHEAGAASLACRRNRNGARAHRAPHVR